MKKSKRVMAVVLSLSLVLGSCAWNMASAQGDAIKGDYVKGEALVLYRSGQLNQKNGSNDVLSGYTIKKSYTFEPNATNQRGQRSLDERTVALVSKPGCSTQELIKKLSFKENIEAAEPNYIYKTSSESGSLSTPASPSKEQPSTPDGNAASPEQGLSGTFEDLQWGLNGAKGINAQAGWDYNSGQNKEDIVAVVDTGVDYTNESLTNAMWVNPGNIGLPGRYGYDFWDDDSDPMPSNKDADLGASHGTHCAGIIAGSPSTGTGILGVAKNTKIMALKVGTSEMLPESCIVGAYNYLITAKQKGQNVVAVNNSWGGSETSYSARILKYTIQKAGETGILSIMAAGNSRTNVDETPNETCAISSPYTINVASTDQAGKLSEFSSYGQYSVDVAAPGSGILSTVATDSYYPYLGATYLSSVNDYYDADFKKSDTTVDPNVYDINGNRVAGASVTKVSSYGCEGTSGSLQITVPQNQSGNVLYVNVSVKNPYYHQAAPSDKLFVGAMGITTGIFSGGYLGNVVGIVQKNSEPGLFAQEVLTQNAYTNVFSSDVQANTNDETLAFRIILQVIDGSTTNISGFGIGKTTGKYSIMSGTSMATPMVSGMVGLLSSKLPDESPLTIKSRVIGGTTPCTNDGSGREISSGGIVNFTKTFDQNPNPVPIKIQSDGTTGTLYGSFFTSGISLKIDGQVVPTAVSSAEELTFPSSGISANDYHYLEISKGGRSLYKKLYLDSASYGFSAVTPMPAYDDLSSKLVAGGKDLFLINEKDTYKLMNNRWERLADTPPVALPPIAEFAENVYLDGYIYRFTPSYDSPKEVNLDKYNINSNTWEMRQSIQNDAFESLALLQATTYNGKIYFAARDQSTNKVYFLAYDPQSGGVEKINTDVNTILDVIPVTQVADKMVFVALCPGSAGTGFVLKAYLYDGNTFVEGGESEGARETSEMLDLYKYLLYCTWTSNGDSMIFSGEPCPKLGRIFEYDIKDNTFKSIPKAVYSENNGSMNSESLNYCANIGDRLYVQALDDAGTDTLYVTESGSSNIRSINARSENGHVEGSGWYPNGDQVTLQAVPNKNFAFEGWYENGEKIASSDALSFRATKNRELEAKFIFHPSPSPTPGGDTPGSDANKNGANSPATGDSILSLMVAAGLAAGIVALSKKKKWK